jgi:hypothetical protein
VFAASLSFGQNTPKVTLDTSETVFTILASINACGYNEQLNASDPLRAQIRDEIAHNIRATDEAQQTANLLCDYYHSHLLADALRELSRYVSLALFLDGPPNFVPRLAEVDLPPDAGSVVGFARLAANFYDKAGLHSVWQRHRGAYTALADRYHDPVSKMLFDTEIYLKLPSAGYLGREFTVILEPMGAPDQENARNYGSNYYVVISPAGSALKVDQIRHTYLHYLLDPMALKYGAEMKRLAPLADSVQAAPMDEGFKTDMALLVTECLIRGVEIRMTNSAKTPEAVRAEFVQRSMEQGYILTRYFYDALGPFEKDPAGIRNAYPDMLAGIDVGKERKRASEVQFASQASPELLHLSRRSDSNLLQTAERRLSAGDLKTAQELAEQALQEHKGDQGRALFIMAQVATANKDMDGAQGYFEKAIKAAAEPKVIAWSHIYLGRIYDLREQRDAAVGEYQAAINAAATLPEVKAAAERGLRQPYEPGAAAR